MEMQENKIIREKLEGLQGLPAGYQPSLESKWALIEAGLDEKKKGSVSPWMWVAAAAVVLVFFTSRWIFSGDQVSNAKHYSASTGETVHEKKTVFPLAVLDFPATVKKKCPRAWIHYSRRYSCSNGSTRYFDGGKPT